MVEIPRHVANWTSSVEGMLGTSLMTWSAVTPEVRVADGTGANPTTTF